MVSAQKENSSTDPFMIALREAKKEEAFSRLADFGADDLAKQRLGKIVAREHLSDLESRNARMHESILTNEKPHYKYVSRLAEKHGEVISKKHVEESTRETLLEKLRAKYEDGVIKAKTPEITIDSVEDDKGSGYEKLMAQLGEKADSDGIIRAKKQSSETVEPAQKESVDEVAPVVTSDVSGYNSKSNIFLNNETASVDPDVEIADAATADEAENIIPEPVITPEPLKETENIELAPESVAPVEAASEPVAVDNSGIDTGKEITENETEGQIAEVQTEVPQAINSDLAVKDMQKSTANSFMEYFNSKIRVLDESSTSDNYAGLAKFQEEGRDEEVLKQAA